MAKDDKTASSTSATPIGDVSTDVKTDDLDLTGTAGGRTTATGEPVGDRTADSSDDTPKPSKSEVQQAQKDAEQSRVLREIRSDLAGTSGHTANLAVWENSPEGKAWLAGEKDRQDAIKAEDKRLAEARDAAAKAAEEQAKHIPSMKDSAKAAE